MTTSRSMAIAASAGWGTCEVGEVEASLTTTVNKKHPTHISRAQHVIRRTTYDDLQD